MIFRATFAIVLAVLSLVFTCCGTTDSRVQPAFRPFADGKYWTLLEPVTYSIRATGASGEVPRGFVTDFASVPAAMRSMIKPYGKHGRAAVIHDYLYWRNEEPRHNADLAFKESLEESGTPLPLRMAMYGAVRDFGEKAWKKNREDWEQGLTKIIPEALVDSIPGNLTWPEYRLQLKRDGVEPRR
jgi:hypothetical protein